MRYGHFCLNSKTKINKNQNSKKIKKKHICRFGLLNKLKWRNLKNIYLFSNQLTQALSAAERIVAVVPDAADEIRDRGLIYLGLECYRPAMADLQQYLQLAPNANDAEELRERVVELHHLSQRIN